MSKEKQFGFGVVEIIVTVLIVAVLAYGGYRLYGHFSKPAATSGSQTNTISGNQSNTQAATTYLDIKELGIKIKLDASIKDAVYSVSGSTATLSTTSIIQQSNGACSLSNGGLAAVTAYSSNVDPIRGVQLIPNGTTIFQVGAKYIVVTLPGAPCWSGSDLGSQQRTAFVGAFKTAQLDN